MGIFDTFIEREIVETKLKLKLLKQLKKQRNKTRKQEEKMIGSKITINASTLDEILKERL